MLFNKFLTALSL